MCNFSEGIEERGIDKGRLENAKETNKRLRAMKMGLENRAMAVGYQAETVKAWDEEELVLS